MISLALIYLSLNPMFHTTIFAFPYSLATLDNTDKLNLCNNSNDTAYYADLSGKLQGSLISLYRHITFEVLLYGKDSGKLDKHL